MAVTTLRMDGKKDLNRFAITGWRGVIRKFIAIVRVRFECRKKRFPLSTLPGLSVDAVLGLYWHCGGECNK